MPFYDIVLVKDNYAAEVMETVCYNLAIEADQYAKKQYGENAAVKLSRTYYAKDLGPSLMD